MKKRFLSLLCVFALVLTLLPTAVFAAEEEPAFSLKMEATVKSGHDMDKLVEGDEVTVKVTAPEDAEMSSFQAHLNFDTEIFECTTAEYDGLGEQSEKTGWAQKLEAAKEDANKNGYLSVSCAQYFDAKGNNVNLEFTRETVIFSGVFAVNAGVCKDLGNGEEENRPAEQPFTLSDIDVAVVKNGKAVTVAVDEPDAIAAAVVRPEVTKLTLADENGNAVSKLSVVTGDSVEAFIKMTPANARYGEFEYKTPEGIDFEFDEAQEGGRFPLTVTVDEDYNEDEAVVTITEPLSGKSVDCSLDIEVRATDLAIECDAFDDNGTLVLKKGGTATLKATLSPSASKDTVTWKSSEEDVATVVNGKVTASKTATGTTTITATTEYGLKATCTVKVVEYISKMTIDQTKLTVPKGKSATVKVTVSPWGANYGLKIDTSGSDSGIVVMPETSEPDANGVITYTVEIPANYGKTSAKVMFKDTCSGKSATCTVSIVETATVLELAPTELSLQNGKTATLKATQKTASGAAAKETVVWSSGNEAVATVDANGKVTAKNPGICTITATTASSVKDDNPVAASCAVTVTPVLKSFALVDENNKKLSAITLVWNGEEEDQTFDLSECAVFTWKDKTEQGDAYKDYETVEYDADGYEDVATVDEDGVVTAVGAGKATVTVTPSVGKAVKLTVNVGQAANCVTTTMKPAPDEKYYVALNPGKTTTLKATAAIMEDDKISKTKPIDTTVTWKTSDGDIATVDEKTGKVEAKGIGTCKVIATPKQGTENAETLEFTVKVTPVLKSFALVDGNGKKLSTLSLAFGGTYDLGARKQIVWANNESYPDFENPTYSTSNPGVATVEDGVITAGETAGSAKITATVAGKSVTVTVKTGPAANWVTTTMKKTDEEYKVDLIYGKTTTLKATAAIMEDDKISKTKPIDTTVEWSSDDDNVAKVDAKGKVRAEGIGTCKVIAKPTKGTGELEFNVTVTPVLSKVTVTKNPETLDALMISAGGSITLSEDYFVITWGAGYDEDFHGYEVTYTTTAKETVGKLDGDTFTAAKHIAKKTTAKITVTVKCGSQKKTCSLTITVKP